MSYEYIKAFHLISVFAWMAGMLYLPRLYVYHAGAKLGSELSETLKVMERRLLTFIMTPAMVLTLVFGIWMLSIVPNFLQQPWMHVKLTFVFLMIAMHIFLWRRLLSFAADRNRYSAKFYRILNEVPTVFLIVIVIMVTVKPDF